MMGNDKHEIFVLRCFNLPNWIDLTPLIEYSSLCTHRLSYRVDPAHDNMEVTEINSVNNN